MYNLFLAAIVLLTSFAGYLFGTLVLGLPRPMFVDIGKNTLECLGFAAMFFIFNILLGVAIGLLVRTVTPWFIGLYVMSDMIVLPLSLVQGLALFCWSRRLR